MNVSAAEQTFARATSSFVHSTSTTASSLGSEPLATLVQYMRQLQLATAHEGWDGERGRPVQSVTWERARVFLESSAERIAPIPLPHVSASGDGYVHLTWFRASQRVVLEIGEGGVVWTLLRPNEPPRINDLPNLQDALERLKGFLAGI